jgi:hypothetical protein
MEMFTQHLHLPVTMVDHSKVMLERLAGVSDPEKKRKIIGAEFIEVGVVGGVWVFVDSRGCVCVGGCFWCVHCCWACALLLGLSQAVVSTASVLVACKQDHVSA